MMDVLFILLLILGSGALWYWSYDKKRQTSYEQKLEVFGLKPKRQQQIVQTKKGKLNVATPEGMAHAVRTRLQDFNVSLNKSDVIVQVGPRVITLGFQPGGDFKDSNFKGQFFEPLCRTLMKAPDKCRFVSSLPGQYETYVGIEIPANPRHFKAVDIEPLLQDKAYQTAIVPLVLGRDTFNHPVVMDLGDPRNAHGFIAGTTGGGKTTLVDSVTFGLLRMPPAKRPYLVLCDVAKGGEDLEQYRHAPNLYTPFVDDYSGAHAVLMHLAQGLDRRKRSDRKVVIVIDELPALLNPDSNPHAKECRWAINQIAAVGRSKGAHLLMLTQNISAKLLEGDLKNNIAGRVALTCGTKEQTNQALGDKWGVDASKLCGNGDMYVIVDGGLQRVQAPLPDQSVIKKWLQQNGMPEWYDYPFDWRNVGETLSDPETSMSIEKLHIVARAIVSGYQDIGRCLGIAKLAAVTGESDYEIGHNILPELERLGVVGPIEKKKRHVLIKTHVDLDHLMGRLKTV